MGEREIKINNLSSKVEQFRLRSVHSLSKEEAVNFCELFLEIKWNKNRNWAELKDAIDVIGDIRTVYPLILEEVLIKKLLE